MADFELVQVRSARQLHENLEKLLKNKKHIESIVVDSTTDEIKVDLSRMANTFGNPDFRIRLQRGKAEQARVLLDRVKAQDSVSLGLSEELFALVDGVR